MNRKQRILFTSVVSFLTPIELLVIYSLTKLDVEYIFLPLLIVFLATPLLLAPGIYFLSFKIWDKKKQEVREDQEPEEL